MLSRWRIPMRLGYFAMPLHPPGADPARTMDDDLVQLATLDRLGYEEAWIGEHFTAQWHGMFSHCAVDRRALHGAVGEHPVPRSLHRAGARHDEADDARHRRLVPAQPRPAHAGPAHRAAGPDGARTLLLGRRLRRLPR